MDVFIFSQFIHIMMAQIFRNKKAVLSSAAKTKLRSNAV